MGLAFRGGGSFEILSPWYAPYAFNKVRKVEEDNF